MPRRQAPAQIAAPRRLTEQPATGTHATGPAIELPPPERPKIIMGKQGYRGADRPRHRQTMSEPGPAVAREEFKPIEGQPTIQDLLAQAQAKADKRIEKLGIGQRKQPVHRAELPEEPPFEIPPNSETRKRQTPAKEVAPRQR